MNPSGVPCASQWRRAAEGHMEPRWGSGDYLFHPPGGGCAATGGYQHGTPMGFWMPAEKSHYQTSWQVVARRIRLKRRPARDRVGASCTSGRPDVPDRQSRFAYASLSFRRNLDNFDMSDGLRCAGGRASSLVFMSGRPEPLRRVSGEAFFLSRRGFLQETGTRSARA